MLRKILALAGFVDVAAEAQRVATIVERQSPSQAVKTLIDWTDNTVERCDSSPAILEVLNSINDAAEQVLRRLHQDLMAGEGNLVKINLLLSAGHDLTAHLRDLYFTNLRQGEAVMIKNGNLPILVRAIACYLSWRAHNFILAFYTPPAPSGFEWHQVYPLYAPVHELLLHGSPRLLALTMRKETLLLHMQRSMSRLLLLVRSVSSDLSGRQTLIANRLVDVLHPFAALSDTHSAQTPYGTNIHDIAAPTLLDGQKPPQSEHRLFFGLEQALIELVAIENLLLSQNAVPAKIALDKSQTPAETLAVLKHLRNRWSGRHQTRKANRMTVGQPADIVYELASIRRHLLGEHSLALQGGRGQRARCMVEDMSATGYGLLVEVPAPWAAVGGLIAVFTPENERWVLGTIRRVLPRPQQKVLVGVQLLSLTPEAIRLTEASKVSKWEVVTNVQTFDNHMVIYLPASALNSGQASVLAEDRVLGPGKVYQTQAMGKPLWLRIQSVLEIGSDYVQYTCQEEQAPVGMGGKTESAGGTDDKDGGLKLI